jgi:phage protein D
MASSPIIEDMEYISLSILIDGTPLKDTYDVLSVEVKRAINAVPSAVFTLLLPLGDSADKAFEMSEADDFAPGVKVDIKAGYNSKTSVIFKGIIVRHGIKASGGNRAQLVLHCQDEAVKMTVGKKVKAFEKQTDSALLGAIIGEYGLGKDITATEYEYPQLLQTGTTDWDFAVTRAEANGLILYVEDGKVFIKKPLASGSAELEISYDRDAFEFEAELDAGYQFPAIKASGWDFATGKFVEAASSALPSSSYWLSL